MLIVLQVIVISILAKACWCRGSQVLRRRTAEHTPIKRCRTLQDFEKIPWMTSNSTFHNLGYPLIKSLCKADASARHEQHLGCDSVKGAHYPHTSDLSTRSGPHASKIIVDPHLIDSGQPSSGAYVINSMFGLLYELGYDTGVRHWSTSLNSLFSAKIAAAAMNSSQEFDKYEKEGQANPYSNIPNWVSMEVEVGMNFYTTPKDINASPYGRIFKWIIGLHFPHRTEIYNKGTADSHCIGANHFLGQGQLCTSAGVIPCPQYASHQRASRAVTPDTRSALKRNVILLDNDQGELDVGYLERSIKKLGGVDDLQVLVHSGRRREDIPDLYKMTKISIDCHNPGVEFINYEAVMYDVLTLSCNGRATRNVFDFPVPSKYHIDPSRGKFHHLVKQLHTLLLNYTQHVEEFKYFKHVSLNANRMAATAVDITYFSRDVVFRTSCSSFPECRRTLPWAIAIWTLYPLARIEVVLDISLEQFNLDNDVILETLAQTFNAKHFKAYSRNGVKIAPVDLFPRFPCAYMVYMDASFLPFGRDFLNTHITALAQDPTPILYWRGSKLVIAVTIAKPYLITLRETPNTRTVYVETDFVIRPIQDWDSLVAITSYVDEIEVMGTHYLPRLPAGPNFNEWHFRKMVAQHPPLPSVPCNSTDTAAYCTPRPGLVIDALYIPPPHHDDDDHYDTAHTTALLDEPHLWLTSTTPLVPIATVLATFSLAEIEQIVIHLDPILQNAWMQKVIAFIPEDIAHVLRYFDANLFPNVVSLIDADNQHWGDHC